MSQRVTKRRCQNRPSCAVGRRFARPGQTDPISIAPACSASMSVENEGLEGKQQRLDAQQQGMHERESVDDVKRHASQRTSLRRDNLVVVAGIGVGNAAAAPNDLMQVKKSHPQPRHNTKLCEMRRMYRSPIAAQPGTMDQAVSHPHLRSAHAVVATGREGIMSTARKEIIVVDDEPNMLKAIERLLNVHGFDTVVFDSIGDFRNRANLRKATCLILDINLSGQSGIDLRREIASAGCSIPVIFITASDSELTRKAAMDAGCVAYLAKPFSAKSLMDAILKSSASTNG
jgi:CheY-like chemotaxis protein